ncbi:MAG: lipopolysaccharide kinase InaA family protein, partial [Planctomycetota bacterium]
MGEIIQMPKELKLKWKIIPNNESLNDWIRAFSTNPIETCDSTGTRIKDGAHRTLWEITGSWGSIHVKMNPLNNLRAYLRRLVRPSKAEMEATNSLKLHRLGVETIEVIGLAEEARIGGSGWLISKTIVGARPLDMLLETSGSNHKNFLSSKLALLVAKLHQIGAFHSDFHPGNIVVSESCDLHVLDIHDMIWKKSTINNRIQNLVILNRWFQLRSNPWDRLRFFKTYWRSSLENGLNNCGDWLRIAKLIEEQTKVSNSRLWKKRDYKCFGSNKLFDMEKCSGTSIHFLNGYQDC